jgi:hypothetical protein
MRDWLSKAATAVGIFLLVVVVFGSLAWLFTSAFLTGTLETGS